MTLGAFTDIRAPATVPGGGPGPSGFITCDLSPRRDHEAHPHPAATTCRRYRRPHARERRAPPAGPRGLLVVGQLVRHRAGRWRVVIGGVRVRAGRLRPEGHAVL